MTAGVASNPAPLHSGEPTGLGGCGSSVTLVEGGTFCLSNRLRDVEPGHPHGLFFRDARVISRWELLVDGQLAESLSVTAGVGQRGTASAGALVPRTGAGHAVAHPHCQAAAAAAVGTVTLSGLRLGSATVDLAAEGDQRLPDDWQITR